MKICLECARSCKQPEGVYVVHCPNFKKGGASDKAENKVQVQSFEETLAQKKQAYGDRTSHYLGGIKKTYPRGRVCDRSPGSIEDASDAVPSDHREREIGPCGGNVQSVKDKPGREGNRDGSGAHVRKDGNAVIDLFQNMPKFGR